MKKYSEIQILSINDIKINIKIQKKNYQKMKFDQVLNFKKNFVKIKIFRRYIAKLKTELNKKINDNKSEK
ncbi:50S ribosomal protein L29 [Blattabacterium punctulatus]|uniref:Large ribosomal subunit protein uL29 n=2 Tax=Blattabacterium punctulatus TaxID=164514 RepID=A0ABM6WNB0_9FLAO|nr:50S ribosomal protein L29 [Blattabacterium punctulatus]AWU39797.1 50S ribosomal protein L29 [Blattabacterium punctulatus]AWU40341.1 50S ribosomal protein L29 [Blattabacterium punctulatus]AWU43140.1 50S ribosomal protein L29 [Blattabacterium punctulatus]AWU44794.1 50S ribosomal protein L29 [Blattabacterium punctulatus]